MTAHEGSFIDRRQAIEPILKIDGITKAFGGIIALDAVSFDVEPGKIVSLVGPNGAGKTTLFNVIAGIHACDRGRILFDGTDVSKMPGHRRAWLGLGRTFQNVRLFRSLNVLENVMIGGYSRKLSSILGAVAQPRRDARMQMQDRAAELLHWVGGYELRYRMPSELSYGDQRRVEIARSLAIGPKLLILDEPTAGMAASEAQEIVDLMHRLRANHITLLLIEHNMNVVMSASDYIVVIDFGRKIAEGAPGDVIGDPRVIAAYLGDAD